MKYKLILSMQKDCNTLSDIQLVNLSLEDSEHFYCLLKRYEKKLLYYIQRLLSVDLSTCEDILQEVFIKIYQNLNAFDTSLKFSSWIYRIAHNVTIDYYRKHKNEPRKLELDAENNEKYESFFKDATCIKEEILNKELSEEIQKVLKTLPVEYKEVLILKYIEEKSYEEMSDILRKPSGTIATLLSRAKKMFQHSAKNLIEELSIS